MDSVTQINDAPVELSIIIVNYNCTDQINQLIHSINTHETYKSFEIIIVDNKSIQPLDFISYHEYKVKVIRLSSNFGFASANNYGTRQASGKYVLYLNPDTLFIEPVLLKCKEFADNHPDAAFTGCRLLNPDQSLQLSYHDGHRLFSKLFWRNPLIIKYFKGSKAAALSMDKIRQKHNRLHVAPWLTGAFLFAKKEALLKNNLLWDEDFFMYWEDVELGARAVRKGMKNYYLPDVAIVHIGGGGDNVPLNRFEMLENSKLRFIEKKFNRCVLNLYVFLLRQELRIERFLLLKGGVNPQKYPYLYNEMRFYGIQ